MDHTILNSFRTAVQELHLGMYGIKIENLKNESVKHCWRFDNPVNLYSAAKGVTSLGMGIMLDEGRIHYEDRVLDYFPEYQDIAAAGTETITIRDMLHMTSGKRLRTFTVYSGEDLRDRDWAELFFSYPLEDKPGTAFYYCGFCPYVCGRIVEKLTGQTMFQFVNERIFQPIGVGAQVKTEIGMTLPWWNTCPHGHTMCLMDLYLTLEDFSKIGKLLLCKGNWNGKQIVSEEYLRRAVTDYISPAFPALDSSHLSAPLGYGYYLTPLTYPGAFMAMGRYGQALLVLPDKETVISWTAHEENADLITKTVFDEIVPLL